MTLPDSYFETQEQLSPETVAERQANLSGALKKFREAFLTQNGQYLNENGAGWALYASPEDPLVGDVLCMSRLMQADDAFLPVFRIISRERVGAEVYGQQLFKDVVVDLDGNAQFFMGAITKGSAPTVGPFPKLEPVYSIGYAIGNDGSLGLDPAMPEYIPTTPLHQSESKHASVVIPFGDERCFEDRAYALSVAQELLDSIAGSDALFGYRG